MTTELVLPEGDSATLKKREDKGGERKEIGEYFSGRSL